jgi:hypothetical protein
MVMLLEFARSKTVKNHTNSGVKEKEGYTTRKFTLMYG